MNNIKQYNRYAQNKSVKFVVTSNNHTAVVFNQSSIDQLSTIIIFTY